MPISVSRGHFALRYEVPKFLPRGGHLCMAVRTIAVASGTAVVDLVVLIDVHMYMHVKFGLVASLGGRHHWEALPSRLFHHLFFIPHIQTVPLFTAHVAI